MSKLKIQIRSVFGNVLFEYEKENNTIKDTLIEAVKSGADLGGANLRGANLRGADLGYANLRGANLRYANIRGANLRGADLGGADLGGANLGGADLGGANLRGADLRGADLGGANLGGADLGGANLRGAKLPIGRCKWSVAYTIEGVVDIGCKYKTVSDWDKWFAGNEQFDTKRGTPEFEAIYKSYLMAKYAIEIGFY